MKGNKGKNSDKHYLNRFSESVKPKKSLGQHFLVDQNIAHKIVEQLSSNHDKVIEVGAGMGVLTQYLLPEWKEKLVVVEIDSESVTYLHEHFPALGTNLVEADFLRTKLSDFSNENIGIIGNFPYNISSQIFFHVIESKEIVTEVVGMIQKEVAERLSSPPGKKAYGILSVLLQAWYDIEYLFTVNENVFNPPPKVKSAVIRLKRNETKKLDCDEILFKKIVKQAFNQRRKTLRNSLRSLLNPEIIENEIFNQRPEQLSVDEFAALTNLIQEKTVTHSKD